MGDLTKNFSWHEFDCKDGTQVPEEFKENVIVLAENLQIVRDFFQRIITVQSAYRHKSYNESVSGSKKSQHLQAKAADIKIEGFSPSIVFLIMKLMIKNGMIAAGGLSEYDTFVHYDIRGKFVTW